MRRDRERIAGNESREDSRGGEERGEYGWGGVRGRCEER